MNTAPIFKSVFGEQWDNLPTVMHKHYANRPYSNDVVTVEGSIQVEMSPLARLLSPLMRLTGSLVPYEGKDIPVTVHFRSELDSDAFCFDRIFHFPGRAPYYFHSRMVPIGGDEVIEFMRIGMGWKARYYYDGHKVILEHCGYVIRLFGMLLQLPLEWLIGKGNAYEEAISGDGFRMVMDIRHSLLGKMYGYSGKFAVTEVTAGE